MRCMLASAITPSFQRPYLESLQVLSQRANLRQARVVRRWDNAASPPLAFKSSAAVFHSTTHGVGIAAFVAKPDLRSPGITVGATYPLGFEIDCVTFAYAVCVEPLLMQASPEPYALSHFTTALSVFDHKFMFFNVMPVQGAPSAQMS